MHGRQELFKGEATIFAHVAKLPNCPELAYGKPENGERLRIPCGLRVTSVYEVSSYFDLSKNSFARAPGMTPAGLGCMLKNCVV